MKLADHPEMASSWRVGEASQNAGPTRFSFTAIVIVMLDTASLWKHPKVCRIVIQIGQSHHRLGGLKTPDDVQLLGGGDLAVELCW